MKKTILMFLVTASAWCNHEPRLESFVVEGKQVAFTFDNGWVFTSESPLESKYYALSRLIGMRAHIDTYPHCPLLELTFENPGHRGQERISFQGWLPKEVYDASLTVENVEVQKGYFSQTGFVTLSDGSGWYIKSDLDISSASNYWANGDKILVTRKFATPHDYTLINQDVSGYTYVDYFKGYGEHFYSMRDPRSIVVTRIEK